MNTHVANSTERQERPRCPRCGSEMQLVRIASSGQQEKWLYHCVECGCDTAIKIDAFL